MIHSLLENFKNEASSNMDIKNKKSVHAAGIVPGEKGGEEGQELKAADPDGRHSGRSTRVPGGTCHQTLGELPLWACSEKASRRSKD